MSDTKNLTQLGAKVSAPASPDDAHLEVIDWKGSRITSRFTVPEFTSLCPVTGQPDFAHIVIDMVPYKLLVESKSLKLFMHSFRNEGQFHEKVTNYIFNRLRNALDPEWLRVAAFWYPRGGIPIDVFVQTAEPSKDVHVPELSVPMYRGRG